MSRESSSCCAVIEESAANARERRYADPKPQPWIVLKMTVGITFGIMGYTAYVYVGVFIVPLLKEKTGAIASRETGIGLLVPFSLLYIWMVWAYLKVIFTSPGYARDYVQNSPKPLYPAGSMPLFTIPGDADEQIGRPSYEDMLRASAASDSTPLDSPLVKRAAEMERTASTITIKSGSSRGQIRFDHGELVNPTVHEEVDETTTIQSPSLETHEPQAGDLDAPAFSALPIESHRRRRKTGKLTKKHESLSTDWLFCCCVPCVDQSDSADKMERGEFDKTSTAKIRKKRREPQKPRIYIARRPPMTPYLHPAHRYCEKEGFVKPYRAHHCRSCGTCVLKYDHHCPWIGQCVGARNHKFFLNFCVAAFMFSTYVFGTLLPYTVIGFNRRGVDVNPQQIVIIALAGLFAMFTSSLTVSHIYMTMQGQTTVESMQIRTMKHRESEQLAKAYGWWHFAAKHQTLKEWNKEWGKLDTEGHLWWIGGRRREWEAVMGKNWLGWIFPIGKGQGDGLDYRVNPRFDSEGRWRRRAEWPPELQ